MRQRKLDLHVGVHGLKRRRNTAAVAVQLGKIFVEALELLQNAGIRDVAAGAYRFAVVHDVEHNGNAVVLRGELPEAGRRDGLGVAVVPGNEALQLLLHGLVVFGCGAAPPGRALLGSSRNRKSQAQGHSASE